MRCHTSGLGSSPVARHYWGNHCYFLFLEVLRCFSSLRSPIRKSLDQRSFAPTQSLSQLITSFIASVSQGIRHAPFFTFANVPSIKTASSYYQLLIHKSNLQSCLCQYVKDLCDSTLRLTSMSLVENIGVEPMTSCMPCKRSSQLS